VHSFEPGSVIVNPPAIFGSLVLGLVALDSSLRSMSAPSLSGALDKKLKEQRQKRRLVRLAVVRLCVCGACPPPNQC